MAIGRGHVEAATPVAHGPQAPLASVAEVKIPEEPPSPHPQPTVPYASGAFGDAVAGLYTTLVALACLDEPPRRTPRWKQTWQEQTKARRRLLPRLWPARANDVKEATTAFMTAALDLGDGRIGRGSTPTAPEFAASGRRRRWYAIASRILMVAAKEAWHPQQTPQYCGCVSSALPLQQPWEDGEGAVYPQRRQQLVPQQPWDRRGGASASQPLPQSGVDASNKGACKKRLVQHEAGPWAAVLPPSLDIGNEG